MSSESQDSVPVAANVLGTIGTVLWCIQLVPQIWYNWRRKDSTGLPPLMMFLWAVSGVPFATYFIVQQSNIPVQVQPHVFMVLSLVCFAQCLYYPPVQMKRWKVLAISAACLAVFAGVEAGLVFPFKNLYERGVTWPVTMIGVIAAILLGAGLLPPYFELWKRRGQVVGINFVFLSIDTGGALFSLLSLVAQKGKLDILGCVLYIVILVLEAGIFSSQIIWLIRTRKARKLAKEQSKDLEQQSGIDVALDEEKIESLAGGEQLSHEDGDEVEEPVTNAPEDIQPLEEPKKDRVEDNPT